MADTHEYLTHRYVLSPRPDVHIDEVSSRSGVPIVAETAEEAIRIRLGVDRLAGASLTKMHQDDLNPANRDNAHFQRNALGTVGCSAVRADATVGWHLDMDRKGDSE